MDRIFIPKNDFKFRDYFNLSPVLPAELDNAFTNLSISCDLKGVGKGDVLSLVFQEVFSPDPDRVCYLVNWDYWTAESVALDAKMTGVKDWLEAGVKCCGSHFKSLYTDRCLKLFGIGREFMMPPELVEETKQASAARLRNQNRPGALYTYARFEDRTTDFIPKRTCVGKTLESRQTLGGKRLERRHEMSGVSMKSIAVPDKGPYILKEPLSFKIVEEQNRVLLRPIGLDDHRELFAEGQDLSKAREDFGRRFDRWVQRNWRVPPHAQTAKNARVIRILDHLVDWERYELDNPLVQPMWGRNPWAMCRRGIAGILDFRTR